MKQRIKNKLIKKLHIAPLINEYEKSIEEWKIAFIKAQQRYNYDEMKVCKDMMWYDYKMMNKIRGRFTLKDISKYRYKYKILNKRKTNYEMV